MADAKEMLTIWTAANKPATLANHAKSIISAVKSGNATKGKIVAHISAIDNNDLWKDAANDDGTAYKSINQYLIDALDISPTAASLWVKVARMVTNADGDLLPFFAAFTVSQLQEMVSMSQVFTGEDLTGALESAGVSADMSCKAIRDAVKSYLACLNADDDDDDDDADDDNAGGMVEDEADTLSGYILDIDASDDVVSWLDNAPASVKDIVTTVLFKRV